MNALVLGFALTTCTSADPEPPKPISPERIKELVKKLEEPTREMGDQRDGPPDGPWPTFNYQWHYREFSELRLAGDAAVPALLALLEDKTKPGQARAQAVAMLVERLVGTKVKPDTKIIATINAALKENDPALRFGTLNSLAVMGLGNRRETREQFKNDPGIAEYVKKWPPPEETSFSPEAMDAFLPQVVATLTDEHPEVVIGATQAIAWFGRPKTGTPELIAALKRKEPGVRAAAVSTLGRVGTDDPAALKAVLGELDRPEPYREAWQYQLVIEAVGRFGPKAKDAVGRLGEIVKDDRAGQSLSDRSSLHDAAVQALGKIGSDAKAAVPALLGCLDKKLYEGDSKTEYYHGRREEVLRALDKIDPTAAKKARADEKRKREEAAKWYEDRYRSSPPIPEPSIFPPPVQP